MLLQAYAMTEASHQMTSNPLPKHGPHKPGTVGRAQGSVKVKYHLYHIQTKMYRVLGADKGPVFCFHKPRTA